MDYDFVTDPLGRPVAHFSMGHEALGHWLTAELGSDSQLIESVLEALGRLRSHQLSDYAREGREYSLQLSPEEAIVQSHALFQGDDELSDDLHYYDAESAASCGLDDFESVLLAWRQFTGSL